MTDLLRERGTATDVAAVAGVTKRSVQRAKLGKVGSRLLHRLQIAAANEVYDEAREERLAEYAAVVESRGGWWGGGYVWENRAARTLAWLEAQARGLREVEGDDDHEDDAAVGAA